MASLTLNLNIMTWEKRKMNGGEDVSGILCSRYDHLFDAERKVADYVMEHREMVVDMTVERLAQASGTSGATVSRFCRRCGFRGFSQMKMGLARELLKERERPETVSNHVSRGDIRRSLENILANRTAELEQTAGLINENQLENALSWLEQARIVQIIADDSAAPAAMDFVLKMGRCGVRTVSGVLWEAQAACARTLGACDVIVIISNTGKSRRLEALMEIARGNCCRIIAITNNPDSPVGKLADVCLLTASREKLLLDECGFLCLSAMFVTEILYLFLAAGTEQPEPNVGKIG
ncbi:MAG: MurR/RpiR family transcriptional regulator [Clostridiales bacterium]|nr:MurR/RpiR family transcriptional regulator [Clostridiales bacterium]